MTNFALVGGVALLLAGCGGREVPVGSVPGAPVQLLAALPSPTSGDVARTGRAALVRPFSELRIEVFGVPDLQRDVMADGNGRVSFPLVGAIDAIGDTPDQLAAKVEAGLASRYVKNPQVSVSFKASNNPISFLAQSVSVDGAVGKPGLYPIVGDMSLMRAVAQAGGLTEFAKLEDVVIFRTVGGEGYAGVYNLEAIRRGNYADPAIYPGDVLVVGESRARRRFRDIVSSASLITTPFIVLSNALR